MEEDPQAPPPPATKTTWYSDNNLHVMTHILTSPTTAPPLSDQFLVSTKLPSYLNWDYHPPAAAQPATLHLRWGFSFFLKRVFGLGPPKTSWRGMCPYLQPPPLSLAGGVEPARWGEEERTAYARMRLRRRRRVTHVHPLIVILIPNLMVLSLNYFLGSFSALEKYNM